MKSMLDTYDAEYKDSICAKLVKEINTLEAQI